MSTITLDDLRHDPATLLARVEAGERILVARDGRAVAELRPLAPAPRPFGLAAGAFVVPDDFDAPLPDDMLRPRSAEKPAAHQRKTTTECPT